MEEQDKKAISRKWKPHCYAKILEPLIEFLYNWKNHREGYFKEL